jgi:PKD repeat protein
MVKLAIESDKKSSMKKFLPFLFTAFGIYVLVGCQKNNPEPVVVAGFGYAEDESNYKKITFTNLSVNYKTVVWNFGDASDSTTEENPVHLFPGEGTFGVKLTATGNDGKKSEKAVNVIVASPQFTITFQPDGAFGEDALLHGLPSVTDTNFGDNPEFAGNAWTFSGIPGVVRSVIDFDLAIIPDTVTITQAYLSLYAWDSDMGFGRHSTLSGSNACLLQRVITEWDENTVTWNTQPATTTQNEVILPESTSDTENYLNIDVTTLVKDMKSNPTESFGFMLKLETESYYRLMNFCSSDHTNPALRPKLVVKYKI